MGDAEISKKERLIRKIRKWALVPAFLFILFAICLGVISYLYSAPEKIGNPWISNHLNFLEYYSGVGMIVSVLMECMLLIFSLFIEFPILFPGKSSRRKCDCGHNHNKKE